VWIQTEDGRKVEAEVLRRARLLLARGTRHYGIAAMVEAIRFDAEIRLLGDGTYKINNNHKPMLARWMMNRHAELQGFFETRFSQVDR
jgi:hypothetical protein